MVLSNGWFFIRSHFCVSIFLLRTGISGWHTEITCLDIYATVITVVALSQHKWYMIGIFSSYCKPYDKTNIRDFANSTQTQIKCLRKLRNKCYLSAIYPGIVNRTFENLTQSNSIELNPSIEFDWVRQSNEIEHHTFSEFDFRTNRIQSNKSNSIELNPSDFVRLSLEPNSIEQN